MSSNRTSDSLILSIQYFIYCHKLKSGTHKNKWMLIKSVNQKLQQSLNSIHNKYIIVWPKIGEIVDCVRKKLWLGASQIGYNARKVTILHCGHDTNPSITYFLSRITRTNNQLASRKLEDLSEEPRNTAETNDNWEKYTTSFSRILDTFFKVKQGLRQGTVSNSWVMNF